MNNGWIRLHRKIRDHWLWNNESYLKAWISILLAVNHEDNKVLIYGELIECKRGQSVMSLYSWAKHFGPNWSIKKVRTFFDLLKNDQMIVTEGLTKTTRLTVCNYDTYQSERHTKGTQRAHRGHTKGTQRATNNNDNNDNNDKKVSVGKFEIPTIEQVKVYFQENGYSAEAGERAWKYYDAGNWHDSSGKPVRSWKQKMRVNWFKDQDKIQSYKLPKNPTEPLE